MIKMGRDVLIITQTPLYIVRIPRVELAQFLSKACWVRAGMPAPSTKYASRFTLGALRARSPVAEEEGEVGGADGAVVVEVGGVVGVRAPIAQENG